MPGGGSTLEAITGCPGGQVGSLGPWNCNLEISDITSGLGNVDMQQKPQNSNSSGWGILLLQPGSTYLRVCLAL